MRDVWCDQGRVKGTRSIKETDVPEICTMEEKDLGRRRKCRVKVYIPEVLRKSPR